MSDVEDEYEDEEEIEEDEPVADENQEPEVIVFCHFSALNFFYSLHISNNYHYRGVYSILTVFFYKTLKMPTYVPKMQAYFYLT